MAGVLESAAMSDSLSADTIRITGHDGDEIEAYLASPAGQESRGGVVVIHHMPGYDRGTKEIARRFAEFGYDAILPNLYWREAPGAAPDDAAATARAQGGVPDARLVGDVAGAAAHLRSLPSANGKVGVIGYCSGGRQSVLAACNVDLDAAVDCYGAFVTGTPPEGFPLKITNVVDQLPNLRAPLLGLFGNDDSYPSPEQVDELEQILTDLGKPHEFHRYDGAGHAFFSVDRPAYRVEAANDGWARIATFYTHHLGG
jgi:carboxymethylenebutenolidase